MSVLAHLRTQLANCASFNAFRVAWAGVCAVQPDNLVRNSLEIRNNSLYCGTEEFPLPPNGVHLIAAGKAAAGMTNAVADILQEHLCGGVVSVPQFNDVEREAGLCLSQKLQEKLQLFEGPRNNLPDIRVVQASEAAAALARHLGASDLLLVLLTGGGSALLSLPVQSVSIAELALTTSALAQAGCNIAELNALRQHLDQLKGGGLARLASPATVLALVLSDVVGDPLEIIASGPTVESRRDSSEILMQLRHRGGQELLDRLPGSVLQVLKNGDTQHQPKARNRVCTKLIGNNTLALQVAQETALRDLGFHEALVITSTLEGSSEMAGRRLALLGVLAIQFSMFNHDMSEVICKELLANGSTQTELDRVIAAIKRLDPLSGRICFLLGGETTVKVPRESITAGCRGGRALHTALTAASCLDEFDLPKNVALRVLVMGSDGADAATGAAGAVIWPGLTTTLKGMSAATALTNCDSLSFFEGSSDRTLLRTGLTGTNVMDIMIVTVEFGVTEHNF